MGPPPPDSHPRAGIYDFGVLVVAEITTPVTDPIIAPLVVLVPLVLLYKASIQVAVRIEASRVKGSKPQAIDG